MHAYVLVGIGGALGSMARYGVSGMFGRLLFTSFPLATLVVNIGGSFAMGVLVGFLARTLPPWQAEARLFLAVGVLGGFTTFSAFSLDTITLIERGQIAQPVGYALLSVVVSVLALYLGLVVTRGVSG